MLVFFFPFFENLGSYVYDSMRARTVLFLKGISAAIFSLRSCTACARVLSLCMRLPALARGRPRRLLLSRPLGGSAAKWTNVVWPIKSRQTNRQTNTHYSFIGIDVFLLIHFSFVSYTSFFISFFKISIFLIVFTPYVSTINHMIQVRMQTCNLKAL